MPVGIVASWRCKCGTFVKVVAEADSNRTARQTASCPSCGDAQVIYVDKIISVVGEESEITLTTQSNEDRI